MATGPVLIAESRILRSFAEKRPGQIAKGAHFETPEEIYAGKAPWKWLKGGIQLEFVNKIRAGFLLHGVDIAGWPGGFTSAAHTDDDVARTVAAFESTFDLLAAEGAL